MLNIKVVHEAVRNIHSLGLFSNIEIMPIPNEKREGGVIVEVKLQETDQKSVEGSADRSIVPDPGGYPSLVCVVVYVHCLLNLELLKFLISTEFSICL